MDSVDSVETVDKTPSILRVYRGYSAGIGGVFRGLFRRGGQVSVSVVGCQLSVSVVGSATAKCRLSGRILMELNKKRLKALNFKSHG